MRMPVFQFFRHPRPSFLLYMHFDFFNFLKGLVCDLNPLLDATLILCVHQPYRINIIPSINDIMAPAIKDICLVWGRRPTSTCPSIQSISGRPPCCPAAHTRAWHCPLSAHRVPTVSKCNSTVPSPNPLTPLTSLTHRSSHQAYETPSSSLRSQSFFRPPWSEANFKITSTNLIFPSKFFLPKFHSFRFPFVFYFLKLFQGKMEYFSISDQRNLLVMIVFAMNFSFYIMYANGIFQTKSFSFNPLISVAMDSPLPMSHLQCPDHPTFFNEIRDATTPVILSERQTFTQKL